MANLISCASGNFTSSSTWAVCSTTGHLDSEAASNALGTTFQYTQSFAPGAITIDAIAFKVASRTSSTSATLSLEFGNVTDGIVLDTITINVSDVPHNNGGPCGWQLIKLTTPLTLSAGKSYRIGLRCSALSTITLYRDGTVANWSRMLRTTTNQAPAANDAWHVLGELTGEGTGNNITVTMNNTAATVFGPTVSGGPPQGATIGNRGTLTWGTSASTNYQLNQRGLISVYQGGTWNMGTSSTPIPDTSTAKLIFTAVANVDSGLQLLSGADFNIYGASKTRWTKLSASASSGNTTLNLEDTTGWKSGDSIVIASTTKTAAQTELRTINTVNSSTQATITAALTNNHAIGGLVECEVGNLTSNVVIQGTSTTLQGFVFIGQTSNGTIDQAEFKWLGSGTGNRRGIDITTITGSCTISNCSIHDYTVSSSWGCLVTGGSCNNFTLNGNVYYSNSAGHIAVNATTGTSYAVTNNLLITCNTHGANFSDHGGTFTGNVAVSCGNSGMSWNEAAHKTGTIIGNKAHSNTGPGLNIRSGKGVWENNLSYFNGIGYNFESCVGSILADGLVAFGNTSNISDQSVLVGDGNYGEICFVNCTFEGHATQTTTQHVAYRNGTSSFRFEDCTFGSGVAATSATASVATGTGPSTFVRSVYHDCTFAESTFITNQTSMDLDSYVMIQKHSGSAGDHRGYFSFGSIKSDSSIYRTDSPSLRVTPSSSSDKVQSSAVGYGWKAVASNGNTVTPGVYVRKSESGDGGNYNGSQPRLFVRKNVSAGIDADTLLATASASNGTWEFLSGETAIVTDDAVLEFYVDCDGTTGWINVDDFSSSEVLDTKGMKYFMDAQPFAVNDNTSGGGGGVAYFAY